MRVKAGMEGSRGTLFFSPSITLPIFDLLIKCDFLFKVKKYVDDPLNWHGGMKLKWVNAMLIAMDEIQRKGSAITLPYFLACGGADQVVKPDSSKYLDKNTQSKDQTFKVRSVHRKIPTLISWVHNEYKEVDNSASKVLNAEAPAWNGGGEGGMYLPSLNKFYSFLCLNFTKSACLSGFQHVQSPQCYFNAVANVRILRQG